MYDGGEGGKRVDIIWTSHHNSTFELCGKAVYLLCFDIGKNHGKVKIQGNI